MGGIEVTSLSIHVLAEHFRGFSRETEKLDASFSTPFVAGGHVLIAAVLSPIPDRQPQNFSDAASRFISHADHNLVTQAYFCWLKTCQKTFMEFWIIDRLGNPIFPHQAKVVF